MKSREFQQRFDEGQFYEVMGLDLMIFFGHVHIIGFSELLQLETFYIADSTDQDSLNSAVLETGGNFLDKNALKRNVKALLFEQEKINLRSYSVKAVEESCVTCGGAHSYQNFVQLLLASYRDIIQEFVSQLEPQLTSTKETPVVQPPAYQAPAYQAPVPQTHGVSKTDFDSYVKANDAVMRNMQNQNQVLQTQGQNMQTQLNNLATSNQRLESMLGNFIKMNTASTSGTLPSNTVTNPKEDLKGITTRSGVAYKGPTIHP
ncbi:hypothetical protein Tco_1465668 [Tanacetum coccineum]